ncbi:hypothetical protein PCE1_001445 [Barthelona sp. PCE]
MFIKLINGTIVNHDGRYEGDVIIDSTTGKICQSPAKTVHKVIDCTGKYIIPGGIDPHVHFQMPFCGTVSIDDFENGSKCALKGGTTMFIDYALKSDEPNYKAAYDTYRKKGESSCCDFGLHMIFVDYNENIEKEMEFVRTEGITSAKFFYAYRGALMMEEEKMPAFLTKCRDLKLLPQVHCEDSDIVDAERTRIFEEYTPDPFGHCLSRPPYAEGVAAQRCIELASETDVPLYIVHNTHPESVERIVNASQQGKKIVGEACIVHMAMDWRGAQNKNFDIAAQHILSPPLREYGINNYIKNYIVDGDLKLVATDHCAFNVEQRRMGAEDFRRIPNGMVSVEERLMVLHELLVNTGRITMEKFVEVSSYNATQLLGIPNKGYIAPGYDADIVIWDPTKERVLSAETHQSHVEVSAWEGYSVTGTPEIVISRGEIVVENGELTDAVAPGRGQYIKREDSILFSDEIKKLTYNHTKET